MTGEQALMRMRTGAILCRSVLPDGAVVWQLADAPGRIEARTGRNLAARTDLHRLPKSEAPSWADQAWVFATTH